MPDPWVESLDLLAHRSCPIIAKPWHDDASIA
jgi:hypothetical protein